VSSETPRARIADIIASSGKMGADRAGAESQVAAMAAAISGVPSGTFLASEEITDALAKRFPKLEAKGSVERDVDAPYETAGRALILALQSCGLSIGAAFDTESGAVLEVKKPMTLLAPSFALTIAVADRGATTHLTAQAQHAGMDWGQNSKLLAQLFDTTDGYLKLFKS
jgi:hypothetical protein